MTRSNLQKRMSVMAEVWILGLLEVMKPQLLG